MAEKERLSEKERYSRLRQHGKPPRNGLANQIMSSPYMKPLFLSCSDNRNFRENGNNNNLYATSSPDRQEKSEKKRHSRNKTKSAYPVEVEKLHTRNTHSAGDRSVRSRYDLYVMEKDETPRSRRHEETNGDKENHVNGFVENDERHEKKKQRSSKHKRTNSRDQSRQKGDGQRDNSINGRGTSQERPNSARSRGENDSVKQSRKHSPGRKLHRYNRNCGSSNLETKQSYMSYYNQNSSSVYKHGLRKRKSKSRSQSRSRLPSYKSKHFRSRSQSTDSLLSSGSRTYSRHPSKQPGGRSVSLQRNRSISRAGSRDSITSTGSRATSRSRSRGRSGGWETPPIHWDQGSKESLKLPEFRRTYEDMNYRNIEKIRRHNHYYTTPMHIIWVKEGMESYFDDIRKNHATKAQQDWDELAPQGKKNKDMRYRDRLKETFRTYTPSSEREVVLNTPWRRVPCTRLGVPRTAFGLGNSQGPR